MSKKDMSDQIKTYIILYYAQGQGCKYYVVTTKRKLK